MNLNLSPRSRRVVAVVGAATVLGTTALVAGSAFGVLGDTSRVTTAQADRTTATSGPTSTGGATSSRVTADGEDTSDDSAQSSGGSTTTDSTPSDTSSKQGSNSGDSGTGGDDGSEDDAGGNTVDDANGDASGRSDGSATNGDRSSAGDGEGGGPSESGVDAGCTARHDPGDNAVRIDLTGLPTSGLELTRNGVPVTPVSLTDGGKVIVDPFPTGGNHDYVVTGGGASASCAVSVTDAVYVQHGDGPCSVGIRIGGGTTIRPRSMVLEDSGGNQAIAYCSGDPSLHELPDFLKLVECNGVMIGTMGAGTLPPDSGLVPEPGELVELPGPLTQLTDGCG